MKHGKLIVFAVLTGICLLFFTAAINAEEEAPCAEGDASDVIEMKNTEAFAQHRMGIVMFNHKKHHDAEPDGYGVGCGECHHDDSGTPLNDLKAGDNVQGCLECHDKTEKPKRTPDMTPEDFAELQLEYYYGAIHENCMGCHKEKGAGPVKCTECHPKPEKAE